MKKEKVGVGFFLREEDKTVQEEYGFGNYRQLSNFEPDPDLNWDDPLNKPQGLDLGTVGNKAVGDVTITPIANYDDVSQVVDPHQVKQGTKTDTLPDPEMDSVPALGRWAGPHPDVEKLLGIWERLFTELVKKLPAKT